MQYYHVSLMLRALRLSIMLVDCDHIVQQRVEVGIQYSYSMQVGCLP